MKRHGNLSDKITHPDNLLAAYKAARRGKRWQRAVQAFERDVPGNLLRIQRALCTGSFDTSRYKTRLIHEPKRRTIYILPFYPDRIVQHAIIQVLEPIWDALFIHDSYACRKGKGMHRGSERVMRFVRGHKYVFKADIAKFYPSIDHEILLSILRQKIKCRPTLALLENIIRSFPGGKNTPIGNYTSQWFGNLYMNELDTFVKQELRCRAYTRYCDDFVIFSDDKAELHAIKDRVERFLAERLALRFSHWAVFPISQGLDFLGYRHWRHKVLARKSTVRRVKRRVVRLPHRWVTGRMTSDQVVSSIASTEGWLRWCNSFNLRQSLGLDSLKADMELL
ncbi:reverse transcriptase domain-containing protein [Guyparkeria halopsychrophila]|uniref:reverse transcriptase domain-containing protein n=1 Tax=Guyparkeria halopsychrophila TaxID=3139421 RepID=UPI0037C69EB1